MAKKLQLQMRGRIGCQIILEYLKEQEVRLPFMPLLLEETFLVRLLSMMLDQIRLMMFTPIWAIIIATMLIKNMDKFTEAEDTLITFQ